MKKTFSNLIGTAVIVVSLFSINPAFGTEGESEGFVKEFCAVSQTEKCKQAGDGCTAKKICFWKDLGQIAETAGKIAATAASVVVIADAID
ncbi:hypothetical protein [Algoriphagus hitonicola]|uniref:Uncharacterized protein n=1 Tax=Algoriphagus hitonicola TaxID=435880 RepID=A0A1I2T120_9BACT|nr:hypothetical protein [Algoriphagus hitonicola]SFG58724.1 hypothetical protein SAMN04487988_105170 [Algoriphagus hitonicola]